MNLNKNSLFRYLCIDHCLRTNPSSTISKLTAFCKEQFEDLGDVKTVSRKIIQKDIQDMKVQFSCPVECKGAGNFYYYKTPDYTFLNVSPETLHNLLQNIKLNFLIGESENLSNIIQFEREVANNGIANAATITRAIISKRMIEFNYHSLSDKKAKKHCVSPYLLKQNRTGWYLMAVKEGESGMRAFNLARFATVATLSKKKSRTREVSTPAITTASQKNK